MVTAGVIALVVIAWWGYQAYVRNSQAKLEEEQRRQFQLTHWTSEEDSEDASVERVLSFADMRMVTRVSPNDGGYLADMHMRRTESWAKRREELTRDGWTEREWLDHGVQEVEIRRLSDGTWQGRPIFKRWKVQIQESLSSVFRDDTDFQNLTGVTVEQWKERGDFYDETFRPWQAITAFAPSIEVAYQRYIHARA